MDIDDFLDKESKGKKKDESSSEVNVEEESKKKEDVQDLIDQIQEIRKLMEEKKFDVAEGKYMEVKEKYSIFAKKQMEVQNKIYNELVSINKQMVEGLNSLRQETQKKMGIIRELIQKVQGHLQRNELDVAQQVYDELYNLFKSLADVVPEQKVQLEQELMSLHIALSSKSNTAATADFQTKFRQIQNMLTYAFNALKQGDINTAGIMYQKINALYNELPKGFLYEKAVAYQQILKLFKAVGSEHDKPAEPKEQEKKQAEPSEQVKTQDEPKEQKTLSLD